VDIMAGWLSRAGHEHVGRPLQRNLAVFVLVGLGFCVMLLVRLGVKFWRTSLVLVGLLLAFLVATACVSLLGVSRFDGRTCVFGV
jgi:hypothetical protein